VKNGTPAAAAVIPIASFLDATRDLSRLSF
jgi:hypothetical protein